MDRSEEGVIFDDGYMGLDRVSPRQVGELMVTAASAGHAKLAVAAAEVGKPFGVASAREAARANGYGNIEVALKLV